MKSNKPLVTIGVAVYNGSKYLIDTLNSIIKQNYSNFELIIIDDCSTDESFKIINQWAIGKVGINLSKNEKNLGVVKVCNKLLEQAKGHYLQIFSQDDIMLPNKIADQIKIFETNNDYSMIFSDVSTIDADGNLLHKSYFKYQNVVLDKVYLNDITKHLLRFNFIPATSVLLKTSVIKRLGGFDESLHFEDLDMWLRFSISHKIYFHDEITVLYRNHSESQMNSLKKRIIVNESLLHCLEKYRNINKEWNVEINKNIFKYTPQLIKFNHPNAMKWAVKRYQYFKDYKTIVYLFIAFLKHPFSKSLK